MRGCRQMPAGKHYTNGATQFTKLFEPCPHLCLQQACLAVCLQHLVLQGCVLLLEGPELTLDSLKLSLPSVDLQHKTLDSFKY